MIYRIKLLGPFKKQGSVTYRTLAVEFKRVLDMLLRLNFKQTMDLKELIPDYCLYYEKQLDLLHQNILQHFSSH